MRSKRFCSGWFLLKNGGFGFWGRRTRIFQVGNYGYEATSHHRHGRLAGTPLTLHSG